MTAKFKKSNLTKKYLHVLFMFCCVFFYSCNNQQDKTFKYQDIEIKAPRNWLIKTTVISPDYGYVIACMNEKDMKGFLIQVAKFEIDLEYQIELMKKSQIENSGYDNLIFSDNFYGDDCFDCKAIYSDFTYDYSNTTISGRLIVFNKNRKTFSLICMNKDGIDDTEFDKLVISKITINSFTEKIKMQTVKTEQVELEIPASWLYKYDDIEDSDNFIINSHDEKENNTFIFMQIYSDDDDLSNILNNSMKKRMQDMMKNPNIKDLYFSDNKIGNFRDYETAYFDYSATYSGIKINGKVFIFCNGGNNYAVISYAGTNYFYDNKIDERILSSIKINN